MEVIKITGEASYLVLEAQDQVKEYFYILEKKYNSYNNKNVC